MNKLILPIKVAMVLILPGLATVATCIILGFVFRILFIPEPFNNTYFLILEVIVYLSYTLGFWRWLFKK